MKDLFSTSLWPRSVRRLRAFVTLALCALAMHAQEYGADKTAAASAVPITPEQKESLAALDVRIGAVEGQLAKIDDAEYRSAVGKAVADYRKRRAALGKGFDQGLCESLMLTVVSRYQTVALWLTPPRVVPRAAKPGETTDDPGKNSARQRAPN